MTRTSVAAAILALASLPLVATAGPISAFHAATIKPIIHEDAVLYDQSGDPGTFIIVSQNFEASLDAYDAQGADDFTVPAGKIWSVTEIDVAGGYYNFSGASSPGAASETVIFYKDNAGKPGTVVKKVKVTGADTDGSFAITFDKIKLKAGKYWVSVQANLDFASGVGGQWGWGIQTTREFKPSKWRNPLDGFGTGCTKYKNEGVCIPDSTGDHLFILKGK